MHGGTPRSHGILDSLAQPCLPGVDALLLRGAPHVESEIESLERIIDCIADPIFVKDERHRLVLVNDAECLLAGCSREDLLGNTDYDILPAEEREIIWAQDDRVIETGEESVSEETLPDAQGQMRTLITRKTRFVDGRGRRFVVGVIRDITEREAMERRLASLAAAVEQAADSIVVTDVAGDIRYLNPAFERVTGRTLAEAEGRALGPLMGAKPQDSLHGEMMEAVATRGAWQGRIPARAKDGRLILHDVNVSAIRDGAGQIVGYAYAGRDVSKQVEIERRAVQAEKLEALGTLAGGVAHDFNNILSAIVGYAQMARMKLPAASPIQHDLEAILNGSHRATDLIKQLLTFSRQDRHDAEPIQAGPIVDEALQFLRASIPPAIGIRRRIDSAEAVLADPAEIHRVVTNLCANGALAIGDAAGVLEVGLDDVELDAAEAARIDGIGPGRYVRLAVSDTGCGMSRELMERIFEPFFTTREHGKGTGLGLSTVHGIVKRCRGAITVDSEIGRGTRFEVYFPVARTQLATPPEIRDAHC